MTTIKKPSDLDLDVDYEIIKYKHIHGTCGLTFLLQAKPEDCDDPIMIKVNGNLYEYLKNKDDSYKFTIKRVTAETGESHTIIDNIGEWIDLTSR